MAWIDPQKLDKPEIVPIARNAIVRKYLQTGKPKF